MGYFFSLSKSAASAGLDISEWMLLIFGAVLVLGIFGEYKKLPNRMLRWPALVFEILVMVGVAGELLGDGRVFVFSRHLQAIEDRELSTLGSNAEQLEARLKTVGDKAMQAQSTAGAASAKSTEAVTASSRAVGESNKATTSASTALGLARGARQEADSFEKEIVSAKAQAAEAEAHLAETLTKASNAEKRASNAEAVAGRVDRSAAPRRLSEQQKIELIKILSSSPPFTVNFLPMRTATREVTDFTDDLMDVFVRMKLLPEGAGSKTLGRALGGSDGSGVTVGVLGAESTQHPPAADLLIRTLRAWGFEASGEVAPSVVKGPTEMGVLVSAKQ